MNGSHALGLIRLLFGVGWALLCSAASAQTAPTAAQQEQARAQAINLKSASDLSPMGQRMLACTACHGAQGVSSNGEYFPRIAGKPAGYLFNQLRHFRDGRRHYGVMASMTAHMDDAYLRQIANYFALQSPPYAPPAAPKVQAATLAIGERLVKIGDPARGLPACVACHGAALAGRAPDVPGLLGLPASYLSSQLGAWASGQRRANTPDCMAALVAKLQPGEIGAVAAWLASQAPDAAYSEATKAINAPVNTIASPLGRGLGARGPAPPSLPPMPIACGEALP